MTLTRRQLLALLLGSAAGPAIAAPGAARVSENEFLSALRVGDIVTFGTDPLKWVVTEVYPDGGVARLARSMASPDRRSKPAGGRGPARSRKNGGKRVRGRVV